MKRKDDEESKDIALEKLNSLIKECEDDEDNVSGRGLSKSPSSTRDLRRVIKIDQRKQVKRQNSASNKYTNVTKKLLKEMEERVKRGEFARLVKPSPEKRQKKVALCRKFKKNPVRFYTETPVVESFCYSLKIDKRSSIIENMNRQIKKEKKISQKFSSTMREKVSCKKELSIISETSTEKNRSISKEKYKRPITPFD